jgi:UDP-N-acetylglucosamine transferase subunit ALG13
MLSDIKRIQNGLCWESLGQNGLEIFVFSEETHLEEFLSTVWWIIVIIGNDNILMWLSSHLSVVIKAAHYSETISFC